MLVRVGSPGLATEIVELDAYGLGLLKRRLCDWLYFPERQLIYTPHAGLYGILTRKAITPAEVGR